MPILAKITHSWCVESEKWVENFFHHWTSEKIPFLYFFLHKSWIWQTLGHVTKKFSYPHFHNASKECFWPNFFFNFMHRFKSAILAKMKNCQNGTFELVHGIQNIQISIKSCFLAFSWLSLNRIIGWAPNIPHCKGLSIKNLQFVIKISLAFWSMGSHEKLLLRLTDL